MKTLRQMPRSNILIPLTSFDGLLRRIDPDNQEQLGATALSVAFPKFASLDELLHGVPSHPKPNRRFAGDSTLPRGRYYSLVQSIAGDDGGTLINELLAYADIPATGGVEIDDLAFPRWTNRIQDDAFKTMFGHSLSATPGLGTHPFVFIFFHWQKKGDDSRSYLRQIIEAEIQKKGKYQDHIGGVLRIGKSEVGGYELEINGVYVYYQTLHQNILRVFDLRTKDAQEFLVTLIRSGELGFQLPLGTYPFLGLLPLLVSQDLGGSIVTDRIGLWMRRHGVEALIYPSARSDCGLRIRNRVTEDCANWNLVDYRGAPIPNSDFRPTFVMSTLAAGMKIEHPGRGELDGSFRVTGIEAAQRHALKDLRIPKGILPMLDTES